MLRRKIWDRLESWYSAKATRGILVMGARQVGKTYILSEFARAHFEYVEYIDFSEQSDAIELLNGAKNFDDLLLRLSTLCKHAIDPDKTCLFFDEIQLCPSLISWMRQLNRKRHVYCLFSGSLLGTYGYKIGQFPAGDLELCTMYPLDFEEFCWANGVHDDIWQQVRESFTNKVPVHSAIHEKLIDLFKQYILVGGMPQAVQRYVDTHDSNAVKAVQSAILSAYRTDITKYADNLSYARQVETIFNAIPAELAHVNRRFNISHLAPQLRFSNISSDFDWLEQAGVTISVHRANSASYPLGLSLNQSFFKLYMNDCGLLSSSVSAADIQVLLTRFDDFNFGYIFENAIAQILQAQGHANLCYFAKRGRGEVDFLIEKKHLPEIIPIEVKSTTRSSEHKALNNLLQEPGLYMKSAIVLHPKNVETQGAISYLPWYMANLL